MLRGYSFRPRLWALALAAAACAAGIALGQWQTRRAEEKRALGARLELAVKSPASEIPASAIRAEDFALKRVAARGAFVAERTVYLDNKLRRGRPGYEVVTPLRLSRSMHVLVNRGWVAAPAERTRPPRVHTPAGEVRIEGIAFERLPHALVATKATAGPVRQNLDVAGFAAESGLALQPLVIQQENDTGDGLARNWPRPDLGVEKHEMYALQWYSLAALAIALFVVLSFRRVAQG
jgi:surfeit locus 1 family protein